MANTKSTQHEIDLTSSLNLNKFKADIKPYEGFNERNSPYYGGCLSPLYIKDDGEVNENIKYINGVKWEINNGKLYKDGTQLMSFSTLGFTKEYASERLNLVGKSLLDYYDDENYIYMDTSSKAHIVSGGIERGAAFDDYKDSRFNKVNDVVYYVVTYSTHAFYGNSNSNRTKIEYYATINYSGKSWGLLSKDYLYVDDTMIQINTTKYDTVNGKYIFSAILKDYTGSYFSEVIDNTTKYFFYAVCGDFVLRFETNTDKSTTNVFSELIGVFQFDLYFSTGSYPSSALVRLRDEGMSYLWLTDNTGYGYKGNRVNTDNEKWFFDVTNKIGTITVNNNYEIQTFYASNYGTTGIKVGNNYSISNYTGNTLFTDFQYFVSTNGDGDKIGYSKNLVTRLSAPIACSVFEDTDGTEYFSVTGGTCIIKNKVSDTFHILCSAKGEIQGIGFCRDTSEHCIGTLITSWGSIDGSKSIYALPESLKCIYYDADRKDFAIIKIEDSVNSFQFIGDFIVINTIDYLNCMNVNTLMTYHFASDWNNRLFSDVNNTLDWYNSSYSSWLIGVDRYNNRTSNTYASGINVNYLKDYPPSIKLPPEIVYKFPVTMFSIKDVDYTEIIPYTFVRGAEYIEIYKDYKYQFSLDGSKTSAVYNRYEDPALMNTTYPGDATRYNIPILFSVTQGVLDSTIVNFDTNVGFFTIYYDNKQRYQYYDSSITEFEQFFIIQGQAYGMKDGKIYSVVYNNGAIQASQPIVSIEGLQFINYTIYNAYFYSPTTKAIYSFGADNNLAMFAQADTFNTITGSSYLPGTGSIIIGTTDCTYVLNETLGIYRLNDIKNLNYASQKTDSVVLVTDDNAYEISYIEQNEEDGWEKLDIVLDTAFYGAGSNVVSVNDCWYVRITDPDHKVGEIKLAVSTLTDIGRTTETKTFKVRKDDWDELTDTIYIRFQPKLQRAVGVSLHIESPFKIGYIGVGATPETLQLNKGSI